MISHPGNFQLILPILGRLGGGIASWLLTNTWYAAPIFYCVAVAVVIAGLFI